MALLSQSPGVCVPTTCYSLCSSEMEEQAVQTTKNRSERRNLSRLIDLHGSSEIVVLRAEKMSNQASSAPPLSGWLARTCRDRPWLGVVIPHIEGSPLRCRRPCFCWYGSWNHKDIALGAVVRWGWRQMEKWREVAREGEAPPPNGYRKPSERLCTVRVAVEDWTAKSISDVVAASCRGSGQASVPSPCATHMA